MKFWLGAQRSLERHTEAATIPVGNGPEYEKTGFTSKNGGTARGALLLFASMILLLFNLLDGQGDSRS
jgi:hypothetical protein